MGLHIHEQDIVRIKLHQLLIKKNTTTNGEGYS